MLDTIVRTNDPVMEDFSLGDLVYSKDDSCGTLYLTVDGMDMQAIQFIQCVSVKVLLGTTRSSVKVEQSFSEAQAVVDNNDTTVSARDNVSEEDICEDHEDKASVKVEQSFSEAQAVVDNNDTTVPARDNVSEEDICEDHEDKAASGFVDGKNYSFQDGELMSEPEGEVGGFTARGKLKVSCFQKERNVRERQREQPNLRERQREKPNVRERREQPNVRERREQPNVRERREQPNLGERREQPNVRERQREKPNVRERQREKPNVRERQREQPNIRERQQKQPNVRERQREQPNVRERQREQPTKMSARQRKQAAIKISPHLNMQKTLNVKKKENVAKKKSRALTRRKNEKQRNSMNYGQQSSSSGVNRSEYVDKLSHSETFETEAKEVSNKIFPHLRDESSHQDMMSVSPDMSLVPQVRSSPKACQYCSQVFESKRLYREHKKTLKTGEYKCELCLNVLSYKAHFQVHMRVYHSGQNYEKVSTSCGECGWEVKKRSSLKKHMMLHTGEYYYKCCVCTRQFLDPGALNHHMKTHSSGGMIRCSCCDQRFATRSALSRHRMVSVEIKCYLCGQVFPNKTSRTQHYKIAHQTDILRCSMCTGLFSSPDELAFHIKKHNANRKKLCKICGQFFSRLEKHVVVHKAKTDCELFICDKCPKKFTNRSSFQRHLFIHSSEKLYQCPHCPKRFTDCGVLRKHLHLHQTVMQYKCEVCNKKCLDSYRLKVHMRVHSSSKDFPCRHCLQAFNCENALKSHMKKECLSQKATFSLQQEEAGLQHAGLTPRVLADLETAQSYQPQINGDPGFSPVYDVSYWREVPPPTVAVSADGEAQSLCEPGCFKYLYQADGLDSGGTLAATPAGSSVGVVTRAPFKLEHTHLNSLGLNREIKPSYVDSHVVGPPHENKDSGYLKWSV